MRIIDVNLQLERILGLSKADVIGKLATEAYGTNNPPYGDKYFQVALQHEPCSFETYFAPMQKHFSISVAPWGTNGFATIFQDITGHKQSELLLKEKNEEIEAQNEEYLQLNEELKQTNEELIIAKKLAEASEQKYKILFETLAEGVSLNEIIYNEQHEMVDYRIIEVNESFYKTADFSSKEVIGSLATKLYGMSPDAIHIVLAKP